MALLRSHRFVPACALFALLAAPFVRAQEVVGSVTLTEGLLVAQRGDGARRLVAAGSKVVEGDTLSTGAQSYAQIRFADDAALVLKPGSRLRVVRYRFDPIHPREDAIELELLDGALQSTAGVISKRSPEAMTLHAAGGDVHASGANFIVSLQGPPAANQP